MHTKSAHSNYFKKSRNYALQVPCGDSIVRKCPGPALVSNTVRKKGSLTITSWRTNKCARPSPQSFARLNRLARLHLSQVESHTKTTNTRRRFRAFAPEQCSTCITYNLQTKNKLLPLQRATPTARGTRGYQRRGTIKCAAKWKEKIPGHLD